MNFAEATQYLLSLGHETIAIKLGLRNISLLLKRLGNPQHSFESVQIAGTNGKGSTAVMLEAICRAARISTGLYTSPHLVSVTERIRIDGREIDPAAFADIASEVRKAAQDLVSTGMLEALPTFFEHVTAIALLAFSRAGIELAILETGLGGRLDATTAVGARTVAITPISLDHQDYLGNTLAEIAAEKAAVIHPDSLVVVAPQSEVARRVIIERCRECGVDPIWSSADISKEPNALGYTFGTENDVYENVQPGLRGAHQLTNAATAIALAETLASHGLVIGRDAIIAGLQGARHPGRLELFESSTDKSGSLFVLLDGAHNAGGAAALRTYLGSAENLKDTPITLVFGAMADKQLHEMAATLFPVAGRLILTQPRNPRATSAGELRQLATKYAPGVPAETARDTDAAMERAISFAVGSVICVTGSLYLVGEVRQWLENHYGPTGHFS
ncbi:MAG TPA: folylpolyglutamate synthase/dihydrofolate synthase family protein [Pyrinomonadaceae bacterium]|jgi:dihydrofolate synthase/folylpolyglutamate synthase|nr:folylpolyglutamate synthase/dihydrofolate synthase family protein [Pyrinomonadaceae bacterium]